MEVHHHAHTARKKWTHYFWEFLMLFLAVFCGFLAENQREHMVENKRARQYIASLYEDLKIDNRQLEDIIPKFKEHDKLLDTMLRLIKGVSKTTGANGLYKYHFAPAGYPDFIYTDRTIQQLKNSGALRLITNKGVSDSIVLYDASVKLIGINISEAIFGPLQLIRQMNLRLYDFRCCPELGQLVDRRNIHYPDPGNLSTYDEEILIEYYNNVQNIRAIFAGQCYLLDQLKAQNHRLRELLKKEYYLK